MKSGSIALLLGVFICIASAVEVKLATPEKPTMAEESLEAKKEDLVEEPLLAQA